MGGGGQGGKGANSEARPFTFNAIDFRAFTVSGFFFFFFLALALALARLSPWPVVGSTRGWLPLTHSRNSCQRFNLRYELLPRSYQHNHKINVPHKIKKLALLARPPPPPLFFAPVPGPIPWPFQSPHVHGDYVYENRPSSGGREE